MNKQEYHDYLRDDHWHYVCEMADLRAIKSNGGRCERCRRNPIECHHHWTYRSLGREQYSLADILACCSGCHAFLHHRSDYDPAAPVPPGHELTPDHVFVPDRDGPEDHGQGFVIDEWGIWEVGGKVEHGPVCRDCGGKAETTTGDATPVCGECLRERDVPEGS
jgi:hypothetical protein